MRALLEGERSYKLGMQSRHRAADAALRHSVHLFKTRAAWNRLRRQLSPVRNLGLLPFALQKVMGS